MPILADSHILSLGYLWCLRRIDSVWVYWTWMIALLANANFKLNMRRRELVKPDLNPPYTRLCKEDIKPTTKLFRDDLSKHLKDMAEAKKAGLQMQKSSDTRVSNHGYMKAGRHNFRHSARSLFKSVMF